MVWNFFESFIFGDVYPGNGNLFPTMGMFQFPGQVAVLH